MRRPKNRQVHRSEQLQLPFGFALRTAGHDETRLERRPTASTLSAANDDEPYSFEAAPVVRKLARAEIDRIPYLERRLARGREALVREHADCNGGPDDEAEAGA